MQEKSHFKLIPALLLLCCLLLPSLAGAHPADDALAGLSKGEVGWIYLKLGFTHILPLGLDHILFVLCIFLLNPKLKSVIWQATAFTVAHSITLGLAMYGVIEAPAHIIEPVIALSIFFVAVENILTDKLKPSRIAIVFLFGLIHGMGFAGVLTELGLPKKEFITGLITFNVGVELGQITVILIAWLLVGMWFSKKPWYKTRVVVPVSAIIALIALYWTIERTFFTTY
ncbi:MAG: HupE/UreJ family protein [Bacteroidota bacterium]|nr:HupE/UreJ family protein [Bacteroidota bacterium]